MVKERQPKVTQGVSKKIGTGALLKKVKDFETKFTGYHNKLAHLVNSLVLPNLNKLSDTVRQLNVLFTRHVVILEILQQRSGGITNEEFAATKERLFNIAKENTKDSSVRSEEAGSDEDRNGHEQPGILDAEVSGDDTGSSSPGSEGDRACGVQLDTEGEGSGASDSEHPTPDSGEDCVTVE